MKPIIGVMPLWDDDRHSLWMLPGYMDGIARAGGIPMMFPLTDDKADIEGLARLCDGFLLTGGHDVSPSVYGETPLDGLIADCPMRDRLETGVLDFAIAADRPVLGICRGIQFINAHLGGTLYQDLPLQHPSVVEHHQHAPYDVPIHAATVVPGSPLHRCLGTDAIRVNSYHHQAVKVLADGLEPMATSPDDLVEALCRPASRFLWAVQWHPEFSHQTDVNSQLIFKAFVDAAR